MILARRVEPALGVTLDCANDAYFRESKVPITGVILLIRSPRLRERAALVEFRDWTLLLF
jgi:hypothetical protein